MLDSRKDWVPGSFRLLPLACLVFLSACVTTPSDPEVGDLQAWRARMELLRTIDQWALNGRLAVAGDQVEDAQGKISWRQSDEQYRLNVRGPFGVGATRITGDSTGVEVRNKKGRFSAENPEAALRQQLGWDVPLGALRFWVLGRPAPEGFADLRFDAEGQLLSMEQQGWLVSYLEYARSKADAVSLPRRLMATREGVAVRLAVDRWNPGKPEQR